MADIITLTPQPIILTGTGKQSLAEALDVSEYDLFDMQLYVPVAVLGNATVKIITGMQKDSENGWNTAVAFTQLTTGLT